MNCTTGKLQYETPHAARLDAAAIVRRRREKNKTDLGNLRPYRCRHCHFWHLTKSPRRPHE